MIETKVSTSNNDLEIFESPPHAYFWILSKVEEYAKKPLDKFFNVTLSFKIENILFTRSVVIQRGNTNEATLIIGRFVDECMKDIMALERVENMGIKISQK